ncbi:hypothetical protein, partial [Serratia nevei]|uniref:hypothetical protein n=1 Tax=Serratia nevei TaxID=2703794 RepID=UPI002AA0DDF3
DILVKNENWLGWLRFSHARFENSRYMPVFVVRGYLKQSKELMPIKLAIGIFCNVACMIRTWHFLDTNSTKEIVSLACGWREHGCLGIPPVLLDGEAVVQ